MKDMFKLMYDLSIAVYQLQRKKNSANQVYVREEYQYTGSAHHHAVPRLIDILIQIQITTKTPEVLVEYDKNG